MVYDELDMLQRLKHPHIVKFVDWFESRVSALLRFPVLFRPVGLFANRTNITLSPSWRLAASCSTASANKANSQRRMPHRPLSRCLVRLTTFTARMSSIEVRLLLFASSPTRGVADPFYRSQAREPPLQDQSARFRACTRRLWYRQDARQQGRGPHHHGGVVRICSARSDA